jgi:hypothetical protein
VLSSVVVRGFRCECFITATGSLFSFSLFFAVCISDIFGHLVGAEAGCNWYFHDINIFPLLEKIYIRRYIYIHMCSFGYYLASK